MSNTDSEIPANLLRDLKSAQQDIAAVKKTVEGFETLIATHEQEAGRHRQSEAGHSQSLAGLQTDLEDLHASHATGEIGAEDHASRFQEIQGRKEGLQALKNEANQHAELASTTLSGLRRNLQQANADLVEKQATCSRALAQYLKADSQTIVNDYLAAAELLGTAYLRLIGMERLANDLNVKGVRLLPPRDLEFRIPAPVGYGTVGTNRVDHSLFEVTIHSSGTSMFSDARNAELLRLQGLGVDI